MAKKRPRANKLLHARPANAAECNDNLTHLAKHEQIHRLQLQHHKRMAQMHADQAKVMGKISTTNELAKRHEGHENKLAERHLYAAGIHEKQLVRTRLLSDKQKIQRRMLQNKSRPKPGLLRGKKSRRRRSHAKDEGKLGNISRDQMGTRFATNWLSDFNVNLPRETHQNVSDPPSSVDDMRKISRRLRQRSSQPDVVNYLARHIFKMGTMTNLSPSGIYNDPKQFGVPRSTI